MLDNIETIVGWSRQHVSFFQKTKSCNRVAMLPKF